MDELIYLSPGKLAQFARAKAGRFRIQEATGKLPTPIGSAELTVATASDDVNSTIRRLNEVKRALERSSRAPLWFEDERVEPGDWIQFEFTARYGEVAQGEQSLFFVVQADPASVRLLLYGSPQNRVGRPVRNDQAFWGSDLGHLRSILHLLAEAQNGDSRLTDIERARIGLMVVLNELNEPFVTTSYVEGWARTVVRLPTEPTPTLLATPLYIRHYPRESS